MGGEVADLEAVLAQSVSSRGARVVPARSTSASVVAVAPRAGCSLCPPKEGVSGSAHPGGRELQFLPIAVYLAGMSPANERRTRRGLLARLEELLEFHPWMLALAVFLACAIGIAVMEQVRNQPQQWVAQNHPAAAQRTPAGRR